MYALLFLTIYVLIYYFIIYKKTNHLDLTKETIEMFKTDFATSLYITVFYLVLVISLVYYIFYTNFFILHTSYILGLFLILFSGIVEYQGIIALKENYYPQVGKEKYLVTKGIFKYIRHPIYLSGIFLGAGIIVLFSKEIFIYLFIIVVSVIIYKVESEEKYLKKRFPKYSSYCKKSNKLIPFIY